MCYIVTRMPTTGTISNVTESDDPIDEVRSRWADTDCVTVTEQSPFCEHCKSRLAVVYGLCDLCADRADNLKDAAKFLDCESCHVRPAVTYGRCHVCANRQEAPHALRRPELP